MNGRKAKAIRKKSLLILLDWIKSLLTPEEAKKITLEQAFKLVPQQTHIFTQGKFMLSSFSLKWITKKTKKLINKKDLKDITLEDFKQ